MLNLTPELVAIVQSYLKGKKLEKFNASVQILNESLAQGGWTSRGSIKVGAGFNGICSYHLRYEHTPEHGEDFSLMMSLNHGSRPRPTGDAVQRLIQSDKLNAKKTPVELINAYIALLDERFSAAEFLDTCRPVPVISAIGLSPRVTATLTEMNLDIDIPSIKLAEIGRRMIPGFMRDGSPLLDRMGNPMLVPEYFVKWTPGTKFGRSRFSYGCKCEACGKSIPSGNFVAIEADDQKSGDHIGLWIGCDCAKNIFGIKDVGMERV